MIRLYLMTKKGYKVLEHLINTDRSKYIHSVVGAKDESVVNDYYNETKELCFLHKIEFYDRKEKIPDHRSSDVAMAISWRWLIDHSNKLIVFHDSILPKYRGFAPLVNMLVNGEPKIGVTALFASAEYDKGDIIDQVIQDVSYPITIAEAIDKISAGYTQLAANIFDKLSRQEEIAGKPQDESRSSYSLWLDEDDYIIDWNETADYIKRFIDATGYPFKGASTTLDNQKIRILKAAVKEDVYIENRVPGKVIFMNNSLPVIVCGKGLLELQEMTDDGTGASFKLKKFRSRFK